MKRSSHFPSSRSSSAQRSVLVVIPARDEAASLGDLLRVLRTLPYCQPLVASDASSDATADLARAHGAWVIEVPLQLGAWGVTQAGLRVALRRDFDVVVTMDGDGQHDGSIAMC